MLTLASSAFGMPNARIGVNALVAAGRTGSTIGAGEDSVSRFEVGTVDSFSHFVGDDLDRDVDASVRALRPRSSRRGSWESEASEWSARVGTGPGSMLRDRSFRTSYSVRTGALVSGENDGEEETIDEDVDDEVEEGETPESSARAGTSVADDVTADSATEEHLYQPMDGDKGKEKEETVAESDGSTPQHEAKEITPSPSLSPAQGQEPETTPKGEDKKDYFEAADATSATQHLQIPGQTPPKVATPRSGVYDDAHSVAPSENTTDVWVSAPSTPLTLA